MWCTCVVRLQSVCARPPVCARPTAALRHFHSRCAGCRHGCRTSEYKMRSRARVCSKTHACEPTDGARVAPFGRRQSSRGIQRARTLPTFCSLAVSSSLSSRIIPVVRSVAVWNAEEKSHANNTAYARTRSHQIPFNRNQLARVHILLFACVQVQSAERRRVQNRNHMQWV